jgi:predicted AAA+ superfamily ATPase
MELRAFVGYRRLPLELAYWRSTHGHEVDFILGEELAVEAKATRRVSPRDLRGLRAIGDEGVFGTRILVSQDPVEAVRDGIRCLPWVSFVAELWGGRLLA